MSGDTWQRAILRVWKGEPTKGGEWLGTSFLISPTHAVTAAHVIKQVSTKEIFLAGMIWSGVRRIEEILHHPCRDVALLQIMGPDPLVPYIALSEAKATPVPGQNVVAVGFGTPSEDIELRRIHISSYFGSTDTLATDSSIPKGMSGASVVDESDSQLVGIIHARDTDANRAYVIPFSAIREFIAPYVGSNRLPTQPSADDPCLRYGDRRDIEPPLLGAGLSIVLPNRIPLSPAVEPPLTIKKVFARCSRDLLQWPCTLPGDRWLNRPELEQIRARIASAESSITLLLGEPGSGKSALLARLGQEFVTQGMTILAIKADYLPAEIVTQEGLADHLGLPTLPEACLRTLAQTEKVVVLVDQLDALADLVVLRSQRLNVLLDLIYDAPDIANVHVVASCRSFEHQHDPRLRNLDAAEVNLKLPPWEEVAAVLKERGIEAGPWADELCESLCTPQNLSVFLEQLQGDAEAALMRNYQQMLEHLWQRRVLSDPSGARAALLKQMATEMAEREVLWLPAAEYDAQAAVLRQLEADGILCKREGGLQVGFRHQTLFEFTRARVFLEQSGTLANTVQRCQDTLFIRPQLWHALTYLRATATDRYRSEFDILWTLPLRPHLRFLLIEFLGHLHDPQDFEAAWLLPCIEHPVERRRILPAVTGSPGWFEYLVPSHLPMLMAQPPEQAWDVMAILRAALKFARERVLEIVSLHWLPHANKDRLTWHLLERLENWDEQTVAIVCRILGRTNIGASDVNWLASTISAALPELAPRIVAAYLNRQLRELCQQPRPEVPTLPTDATMDEQIAHRYEHDPRKPFIALLESRQSLYDLPAIAEVAPGAFLDALWLWYLELFHQVVGEPHGFVIGYQDTHSVIMLDEEDGERRVEYPLVIAVETAVTRLAETNTDNFLSFLNQNKDHDLLPVQRLLARGLVRLASSKPEQGLTFLLADPRRLVLGTYRDVHADTKRLIAAIVPHLTEAQSLQLEEAIWNWNRYSHMPKDDDPKTRHKRLQWNREHRLSLWQAIPTHFLSPAARRTVEEEERAFPQLTDRDLHAHRGWIGSPVSADQMMKAKDANILNLFDELTDVTEWDHPRYHFKGGTIQASREFEKLAKEDPKRTLRLIEKLQPGKNEITASHGINGLVEAGYPPDEVFALIQSLDRRGFHSADFRHAVAGALERLVKKDTPLPEEIINILIGWLRPDEVCQDDDQEEAGKENDAVESVLWGHAHWGVLPRGNYPILATLSKAFLLVKPVQADRWMQVLEDHLKRPERAKVWSALTYFFQWLHLAGHRRSEDFLDRLFQQFPSVLASIRGVRLLAEIQSWAASERVFDWLRALRESDWPYGPQAYAEVLMLRHAWFPHEEWSSEAVQEIRQARSTDDKTRRMRMGLAFTAARLWSEPQYRSLASQSLRDLLSDPEKDVLSAASTIFLTKSLFADAETWSLLDATCEHPKILRQSNTEFLLEQLEQITPIQPERVYRVCNALLNQVGADMGNVQKAWYLAGERIVNIALTLQHLGGEHCAQGTSLFERMLDLDVPDARTTLLELDKRTITIGSNSRLRRRRWQRKR